MGGFDFSQKAVLPVQPLSNGTFVELSGPFFENKMEHSTN